MSNTTSFNDEQSLILRDLETALENFRNTELLDWASFEKTLGEIETVKSRLWDAFPELSKTADIYYFDEFADNPEFDERGYEDVLFNLLLSLIQLSNAKTFGQFATPLHNLDLGGELYEVLTFAPEYNSQCGGWMV